MLNDMAYNQAMFLMLDKDVHFIWKCLYAIIIEKLTSY